MKEVKRILAIVLTVASICCLQMSIVGVSDDYLSELRSFKSEMQDEIDKAVSNLDRSYMAGVYDLDDLVDFLEDEREDGLAKDLAGFADDVDKYIDKVADGALNLWDIRSILNLPQRTLDLAVDICDALDVSSRDADSLTDFIDESGPVAVMKTVSLGITVFMGLMVVTAIANVACIVCKRKNAAWLLIVLWSVDMLVMLAPVVLFMIEGSGELTVQVGPILGLAFAIAATVMWSLGRRELMAETESAPVYAAEMPVTAPAYAAEVPVTAPVYAAEMPVTAPVYAAEVPVAAPVYAAEMPVTAPVYAAAPQPVPQRRFCSACGAESTSNGLFCTKCGTKL